MTYQEKLQDKRWKDCRERILTYYDNKCQECGATQHLQIHHCLYLRGKEPWEYPASVLIPLCPECHEKRQELEDKIKYSLACNLKFVPIPQLVQVTQYLMDQAMRRIEIDETLYRM